MIANDVAVGDTQRLAPFETPKRLQHHRFVLQGVDLAHQIGDHVVARKGLSPGQSQKIEALGIGNEQVAEILAGGEDLHQDRQGLGISLQQRRQGQRIHRGGKKPLQVVQGHVGIGAGADTALHLGDDDREQIERDPAGGDLQQIRVPPRTIFEPHCLQPLGANGGIVQISLELQ